MLNLTEKFIFCLFLILSLSEITLANERHEVGINEYLPNALMNGLTNNSRTIEDYRGKPLIINVWASWCGPCNDEMRSIEELNKRYGNNQFNLIGVSIDDDKQAAVKFVRSNRLTFENFIDNNLILEKTLGAKTIPLTLLIDSRGRVVEKVYGSKNWMSTESRELIKSRLKIQTIDNQ